MSEAAWWGWPTSVSGVVGTGFRDSVRSPFRPIAKHLYVFSVTLVVDARTRSTDGDFKRALKPGWQPAIEWSISITSPAASRERGSRRDGWTDILAI